MPPHPISVQPGQESVWDYPRPPRLEQTDKRIQIIFNGVAIADTMRAFRVLETSHPPVYYLPREDIQMQFLTRASDSSVCEWKGAATYFTLDVGGKRAEAVAWSYDRPTPASPRSRATWRSMPGRWMRAWWTASASHLSPAASTAAGSPAMS